MSACRQREDGNGEPSDCRSSRRYRCRTHQGYQPECHRTGVFSRECLPPAYRVRYRRSKPYSRLTATGPRRPAMQSARRDGFNLLGNFIVIAKVSSWRGNFQMTVQSKDASQQFGSETVHHRHHNDEGRDTKHYAEKREPGDDGDKPSCRFCPQIAKSHQTFKGGKHR